MAMDSNASEILKSIENTKKIISKLQIDDGFLPAEYAILDYQNDQLKEVILNGK